MLAAVGRRLSLAAAAAQPMKDIASRAVSSSAPGLRLKYVEWPAKDDAGASRPPIVISHGMLGSLANWSTVAKYLNESTGRRVVAYDARNHGDSPHANNMSYADLAQDLIHLLQEDLKADEALLMGHSMGGRTSMMVGLQRPELVERLVLVDISPINVHTDLSDPSSGWGMSYIFEALLSVEFPEPGTPLSKVSQNGRAFT